jgi:acyl-CoA synthetase (NDP forming)
MDLFEQLDRVFNPRSVAVVGASDDPGKAGHDVLYNLKALGFPGAVYPVNPTLPRVQGFKSYASVKDIPGTVDLVIVAVPARLTLRILEDCASKGIHAVVMYTSGFKEVEDKSGPELEAKLLEIAETGHIRIVGPNCLGVMNPSRRFNGTFIPTLNGTAVGNVAVVAQSGGASVYAANELTRSNLGVSKLLSIGNRANLNFHDAIRYFAADEETRVIMIYIEGLDRPREFMSAAREAAAIKPVVVYKVGRSEQSSRASVSHTGAMAGNYEIYKAAFKQCGVIATDTMTELVDVTKALALQPAAAGDNVAILSASAGFGIIMTDKLGGLGLKLADFSIETKKKLE